MQPDVYRPVYVLVGNDEYLRDSCRRRIIAQIIGDADPQLCVAFFEPPVNLSQVLAELGTLPFLAPRRAVVVRNADDFVEQHREDLEKYLQKPSPTASLVLMVDKWSKVFRLSKLVAKIGEVCECSIGERENLVGRVNDLAKSRGKKIASPAAAALLENVGRDLAALDNEMEKLALYTGQRPSISIEDVQAVTTPGRQLSDWALQNAVTNSNARAALNALASSLRTRGDEFRVLGSLAAHIRRAIKGKNAALAGEDPAGVLPFNMPFQAKRDFLNLLNRRSLSKFNDDARRLIAGDLALKSGAKAPGALAELVVALCN
jgi:DNA polymerase-3 subunit delta